MGYESRLYIVNKSSIKDPSINMVFGEIIAMFNLSKVNSIASKFSRYPDTDTYIYADDGNTRILVDAYDERLKEIPVDDAIKIIEKAAEEDHWSYRRWKPVLGLLKGFNKKEWSDLAVLHYGY